MSNASQPDNSVITEEVLTSARRIGRDVARRWKGVDADDVIGALHLWLVNHRDHLKRWMEDGGELMHRNFLTTSLYREARRICQMEVKALGRRHVPDAARYTEEEVLSLWAVMWHLGDDTSWASVDPSRYAELAEVREAWFSLSQADRDIISSRWGDGLEWQAIADAQGLEMRTARMRGVRALKRLVNRTGTSGVRLSMDKDFSQYKGNGSRPDRDENGCRPFTR